MRALSVELSQTNCYMLWILIRYTWCLCSPNKLILQTRTPSLSRVRLDCFKEKAVWIGWSARNIKEYSESSSEKQCPRLLVQFKNNWHGCNVTSLWRLEDQTSIGNGYLELLLQWRTYHRYKFTLLPVTLRQVALHEKEAGHGDCHT